MLLPGRAGRIPGWNNVMDKAARESSDRSITANRLSRDDWTDAAMDALAKYGMDGVRVEKLAKSLNVTKGSFYWHFRDRDELLDAIIEKWRRENTINIIEYVGSVEDPHIRLRKLARMPFEADLVKDPLGLPLRLWARYDDRPRKALAEVDDLRVRMNAQLFRACGFAPADAEARSVLLYSYMRVAMTLADLDDENLRARCEELLLRSGGQE